MISLFRTAAALAVALTACANPGKQHDSMDSAAAAKAADTAATPTSAATTAPANDSQLVARADSGRTAGSADATVWVLEISDFQCPYCKGWHDNTYPTLRDEYIKTGKIRFAFVNFPLDIHAHATGAATAAMCAGAQGKFWAMQSALFATQREWGNAPSPTQAFARLASNIGVDANSWKTCMSSPGIKALIAADQYRVAQAGARATPSFLINGKLIQGAVPIEPLRNAIDAALAESKTVAQ
jgi:protein-disulfide isomerase